MKQTHLPTWIALAAITLCSACTSAQPKTATLVTPASQQVAALKWDEAIAATTTARVNNGGLISMR